MTKQLKIGITGGIGSGKSTVCEILRVMDFPVYVSDAQAKILMNSNAKVMENLKQTFGAHIYINGKLDNVKLGELVFKQPKELEKLNAIVHPAVRQDFSEWCTQQSSKLVFQESALLFETGAYQLFDKNVLVSTPLHVRLERVMKRDNCSREQVLNRINNQLSEEAKEKLADFRILNNDEHSLIDQVGQLTQTLTLLLENA